MVGAGAGGGGWRALPFSRAAVGGCLQVPVGLLGIFLKFYEIMRAEVLQGAGCVGITTGGSSGTVVFASDSGSRAARGSWLFRNPAPWPVHCLLASEPSDPSAARKLRIAASRLDPNRDQVLESATGSWSP